MPEYNGHYENSTFTTRQKEAAEVAEYLRKKQIIRTWLKSIRLKFPAKCLPGAACDPGIFPEGAPLHHP